MAKKIKPITPGEILLEEFMVPYEISQNKLARDLDVPVGRINDIVKGKRAITTDTALRLSIYFATTAEFWLNLQNNFELKLAERELKPRLQKAVRPYRKQVA